MTDGPARGFRNAACMINPLMASNPLPINAVKASGIGMSWMIID